MFSIILFAAIRTSISDDWSSTGFMEAAVELEGNAPEAQKLREKREKERQKERAKVEKEKEYDDGNQFYTQYDITILLYIKNSETCSKYMIYVIFQRQ